MWRLVGNAGKLAVSPVSENGTRNSHKIYSENLKTREYLGDSV
jgi:hypothetical protein